MLNDIQIELVLKDLKDLYGHDFNYYSRDSFDRRVNRLFKLEKFESFEHFSGRLRNDKDYVNHFINRITVNVTEMFRNPEFFSVLREQVLPVLAQRPVIRIWHPGCSTGEEVLSVAILMKEAGLLEKCQIYATDINQQVLDKAKLGIFSSNVLTLYEKNYVAAGGLENFKKYYSRVEEGEQFNADLRSNIRFIQHNLASAEMIAQFDLVVCRNVLIYFDKFSLQRAFRLFDECTTPNSFLALGEKETLQFSAIDNRFTKLGNERIWKKTN